MRGTTRAATPSDVPRMVDLSEQKRSEYAAHEPVFWRKAADSREKQTPYFETLLSRESVIALVHERGGAIDGFLIAALVPAPPVYDPGGLICLIDDFVVADPDAWQIVGAALLAEVGRQARARGAVQFMVICGHRDGPKRAMLAAMGLSLATEIYVGGIG